MTSSLEFMTIGRQNQTALSTIPADSAPCDELTAALEVFWNEGAVITDSHGVAGTYAIWLHGSTPFERDRVFRVRVIPVGQGQPVVSERDCGSD